MINNRFQHKNYVEFKMFNKNRKRVNKKGYIVDKQ